MRQSVNSIQVGEIHAPPLVTGGGVRSDFSPGYRGIPCFRIAPLPVPSLPIPVIAPLSPTQCAWLLETPERAGARGQAQGRAVSLFGGYDT